MAAAVATFWLVQAAAAWQVEVAEVSPSGTVQVRDIEIAYRVTGESAPLVMIMGFAGTMDSWDLSVLQALERRYQVIVFDNRGLGGTSAPPGEFSIEQFADDTAGGDYLPGPDFSPHRAGSNSLHLSFAWLDPDQIPAGIVALAGVIEEPGSAS